MSKKFEKVERCWKSQKILKKSKNFEKIEKFFKIKNVKKF